MGETKVKKTSMELPEPLWRAVKIRALDEGTDFRSVLIKAIEAYLKTKVSK